MLYQSAFNPGGLVDAYRVSPNCEISANTGVPVTSQAHVTVLNVAVSQQASEGCVGCVPVTTQAQEVLSNAADSQHDNDGCVGCVPVTTQAHVNVSKVAVSQHANQV